MVTGKVFITVISNWSKKGYITAILVELKKGGDHEWHMLDGSIIKVHQDAMRSGYDKAAEAIGSSVGGLSTKIHAKVDSLGQLVNVLITPGQVHESQVANDVWASEHCDFFWRIRLTTLIVFGRP
jgi:hypothetical protein